ncbi:WD40 repeat domain-containing protein [Litchfieldella rifensis]|uniref:WD40 repeat domain-containing protein n=1 Tax=Litchfieldella rifensis TaxID=762643 RepID=A0ABV7LRX6_9GAMM
MSRFKKSILGLGAVLLISLISGVYAWQLLHKLEPVTALGVSSDGRYAVTTHQDGALVLWDIENRSRDVLSTEANLYSAYFISDSDAFLWQDLDNVVRIQRVDGKVIEAFEHFPTYGHVMDASFSDYLASDVDWNIFHGHGEAIRPVMQDGISPSFKGSGKILKLTLSEQGQKFVSAGLGDRESPSVDEVPAVAPERRFSNYTGVTLWDLDTLDPIAMLPGNSYKVDATISPDGQWVVSGDENTLGFFWNTDAPQERHRMASYNYGILRDGLPEGLPEDEYWDKSELIPVPKSTKPDKWGNLRSLATPTTIAIAFINGSEEFLRIGYSHYTRDKGMNRTHAALFEAGNPWPQAYLDLGIDPYPSINNYSRNLSIDSAPEANLLVTGHAFDGGITVYRYDPEVRTLSKEWVGK